MNSTGSLTQFHKWQITQKLKPEVLRYLAKLVYIMRYYEEVVLKQISIEVCIQLLHVRNRLFYLVVEYDSDVSAICSTLAFDNDANIAADGRIDISSHAHHPDSCSKNVLCSDTYNFVFTITTQ